MDESRGSRYELECTQLDRANDVLRSAQERRVQQVDAIQRLRSKGIDTGLAERVLAVMYASR